MAQPLEQQLAALPADVQEALSRYRFNRARFIALADGLRAGGSRDNLVKDPIRAPDPHEIEDLSRLAPAERKRLAELGRAALAEGRIALLVLAGGMATRMGGGVKALVPALTATGDTFLDLRVREAAALGRRFGKTPPLWLMVSHATEASIQEALGSRLDGETVALFAQDISLRLTPSGDIFLDPSGRPSLYATGHGDLPEALARSGLLTRFIDAGGQVVMVTNLDNLGAGLDEEIIGWHLSHGAPLSSEVVDKVKNDRGGIPVHVADRLCVLEEFRIPPSFDASQVRVFNTNVFHVEARALRDLKMDFSFFRVEKSVKDQRVVQFERLINEVTSVLPTHYLHVPREGEATRFLPVKDPEELAARQTEIALVARTRSMLS